MKIEELLSGNTALSLPPGPRFPSGVSGQGRIAFAAQWLADNLGYSYAQHSSPVSPHPLLTANYLPGESALNWLRGHNKCNQFAGDALTWAGYQMPLYRMHDGSYHYRNAEALPAATDYFTPVSSRYQIQAGNLLVLDWKSRRENGAHVEVISSYDPASDLLKTIGVQPAGVEERSYSGLFRSPAAESLFHWQSSSQSRGDFDVYILQAIKASQPARSAPPQTTLAKILADVQ